MSRTLLGGTRLGGLQLISFALPGLLGVNFHWSVRRTGEREPGLQLHVPVCGRATALGSFNDDALEMGAEVEFVFIRIGLLKFHPDLWRCRRSGRLKNRCLTVTPCSCS